MVRLKDIAQRAGVSVMTVSKALRDAPDVSAATKSRIRLLAGELGYVPDSSAQGLRTGTTRLLGLAVPSCVDPVLSRVLLAITEHAYHLGYDVLLAQTLNEPEREEACIRRFLSRRVDGVFIAPVERITTEARIFQELVAAGVPTLVLGPCPSFCLLFSSVGAAESQGVQEATAHLLSLGHKRIAFLAGPPGAAWAQQRFEGYRSGLRQAGLDVEDRLVFQAGRTVGDSAAATAQMIGEGASPTAIIAVTDVAATGCIDELLRRGRSVPGDVSVVGFGDTLLSRHNTVPLTTVHQPKYRLGVTAVAAMKQLLRGQKPSVRPLPTELVIRKSTGICSAASVSAA